MGLNFVAMYVRKTKTFNIEMSLMEKKMFFVNMSLSGTLNSGGGAIFFMRQWLIIQDYKERQLAGYSSKDRGFQIILALKDLEVRVSYLKCSAKGQTFHSLMFKFINFNS